MTTNKPKLFTDFDTMWKDNVDPHLTKGSLVLKSGDALPLRLFQQEVVVQGTVTLVRNVSEDSARKGLAGESDGILVAGRLVFGKGARIKSKIPLKIFAAQVDGTAVIDLNGDD